MRDTPLKLNLYDVTSIILTGLATAVGVSFSFLPTPLPGPVSPPVIAGTAVLFASVSALLQVISVNKGLQKTQTASEQEMVEIPRDLLDQELEKSYELGKARAESISKEMSTSGSNSAQNIQYYEGNDGHPDENPNTTQLNYGEVIKQLRNQVDEIKSEITDSEGSSLGSQVRELESQIDSIEQEVESLRSETVTHYEFREKEKELQNKIRDNRQYIRTVYQLIKDNLDEFDPPVSEDSGDAAHPTTEVENVESQEMTEKEFE